MSDAAVLSPESLIQAQQWRYATKKFDPAGRIAPGIWSALEQSLVLSPSSFGLEPWKFIVVTDPALKSKLRGVSWNQSQIEDCSHLVVFLARTGLAEADLDRSVARIAEVRQQPLEALEAYKGMMMGYLVNGPAAATVDLWAVRQVYIALGNFMTSAALLGVDTCPMEGLDPAQYDQLLGLEGTGYHTVCACPAGYRASDDAYATKPKVRFPLEQVIERR
jgi:nitroreductase